jgi:hypothetical protein
MRLKVRPNYLLVFAVRGKRKVGSLYSPTKGSLSDYSQVQTVWVAELGEDCAIASEGVVPGSKGFVIDSYEFEDVGLVLWPEYRKLLPLDVVGAIEREAEQFDGIITANVIHQASIFAIEEKESVCQAMKGSSQTSEWKTTKESSSINPKSAKPSSNGPACGLWVAGSWE